MDLDQEVEAGTVCAHSSDATPTLLRWSPSIQHRDKTMKTLMRATLVALAAASLLPACSSMGWGQKSSGGSTHSMTGGAEATTTDKGTPQPAGPKGSSQGGSKSSGGSQSGTSTQGGAGGMPSDQVSPQGGSSQGATQGGTSTQGVTGGAEAAPTDQATPQGGSSQGTTQGGGTAGGTPSTSGQSQGGMSTEQMPARE